MMTSDEDKEKDGNEEHDTSIVAFPGADDEYVEDHPPVPPGLRLDGSKIIDRDEADDVPASPPSPTRRRRNLTGDWMENFESMVKQVNRKEENFKAALALAREQCTESAEDVMEMWNRLDLNHDGTASFDEFFNYLRATMTLGEGIDEDAARLLFDSIDVDRSGSITKSEFLVDRIKGIDILDIGEDVHADITGDQFLIVSVLGVRGSNIAKRRNIKFCTSLKFDDGSRKENKNEQYVAMAPWSSHYSQPVRNRQLSKDKKWYEFLVTILFKVEDISGGVTFRHGGYALAKVPRQAPTGLSFEAWVPLTLKRPKRGADLEVTDHFKHHMDKTRSESRSGDRDAHAAENVPSEVRVRALFFDPEHIGAETIHRIHLEQMLNVSRTHQKLERKAHEKVIAEMRKQIRRSMKAVEDEYLHLKSEYEVSHANHLTVLGALKGMKKDAREFQGDFHKREIALSQDIEHLKELNRKQADAQKTALENAKNEAKTKEKTLLLRVRKSEMAKEEAASKSKENEKELKRLLDQARKRIEALEEKGRERKQKEGREKGTTGGALCGEDKNDDDAGALTAKLATAQKTIEALRETIRKLTGGERAPTTDPDARATDATSDRADPYEKIRRLSQELDASKLAVNDASRLVAEAQRREADNAKKKDEEIRKLSREVEASKHVVRSASQHASEEIHRMEKALKEKNEEIERLSRHSRGSTPMGSPRSTDSRRGFGNSGVLDLDPEGKKTWLHEVRDLTSTVKKFESDIHDDTAKLRRESERQSDLLRQLLAKTVPEEEDDDDLSIDLNVDDDDLSLDVVSRSPSSRRESPRGRRSDRDSHHDRDASLTSPRSRKGRHTQELRDAGRDEAARIFATNEALRVARTSALAASTNAVNATMVSTTAAASQDAAVTSAAHVARVASISASANADRAVMYANVVSAESDANVLRERLETNLGEALRANQGLSEELDRASDAAVERETFFGETIRALQRSLRRKSDEASRRHENLSAEYRAECERWKSDSEELRKAIQIRDETIRRLQKLAADADTLGVRLDLEAEERARRFAAEVRSEYASELAARGRELDTWRQSQIATRRDEDLAYRSRIAALEDAAKLASDERDSLKEKLKRSQRLHEQDAATFEAKW
eukprot:g5279.t1